MHLLFPLLTYNFSNLPKDRSLYPFIIKQIVVPKITMHLTTLSLIISCKNLQASSFSPLQAYMIKPTFFFHTEFGQAGKVSWQGFSSSILAKINIKPVGRSVEEKSTFSDQAKNRSDIRHYQGICKNTQTTEKIIYSISW